VEADAADDDDDEDDDDEGAAPPFRFNFPAVANLAALPAVATMQRSYTFAVMFFSI
jgi:hypothetical protein